MSTKCPHSRYLMLSDGTHRHYKLLKMLYNAHETVTKIKCRRQNGGSEKVCGGQRSPK
ncbi:hypothetical protein L2734_18920 [Parashewanella spongiae]|uniref:hypothetical protein n=1 Tax=Parashewanella spongiae TaxID=342950 RepID=UPI001404FFBE|nr:hypothetical protein [Parashewanella spongiae]MCL1080200.1 hypothetical protein [Parashewanella spongiae]